MSSRLRQAHMTSGGTFIASMDAADRDQFHRDLLNLVHRLWAVTTAQNPGTPPARLVTRTERAVRKLEGVFPDPDLLLRALDADLHHILGDVHEIRGHLLAPSTSVGITVMHLIDPVCRIRDRATDIAYLLTDSAWPPMAQPGTAG